MRVNGEYHTATYIVAVGTVGYRTARRTWLVGSISDLGFTEYNVVFFDQIPWC